VGVIGDALLALKGPDISAQGIALGLAADKRETSPERAQEKLASKPLMPFQGGISFGACCPRALPWAEISGPFRAKSGRRQRSSMNSFVIPADYCVALIDAAAYPSFIDENWNLPQIKAHFVTQMNRRTMLAWGTGASGNWRVGVGSGTGVAHGFREFAGSITATGTKLHLTSYDELNWGAQFQDARLPRRGTEEWSISLAPGEYHCRVVQLYDPAKAESEEVFNQKSPHFLLEIKKATHSIPSVFEQVPWFADHDC
jgi:hypothetical protein